MPNRAEFEALRAAPGATPLEAALAVARLLEPDTDAGAVRAQCLALGERCGAFLAQTGRTAAAVGRFFVAEGYRGADANYYSLDNSRIDRVLQTRRGIPITLAILYLEAARCCGLPAAGVNFPGHFLVRIGDTILDPWFGEVLDGAARERRLAGAGVGAGAFADATSAGMALRMLANVRGVLVDAGELARALEVVDCQLALEPAAPALLVEQAGLWERLGGIPQAIAALRAARAALAPRERPAALEEWLERLTAGGTAALH